MSSPEDAFEMPQNALNAPPPLPVQARPTFAYAIPIARPAWSRGRLAAYAPLAAAIVEVPFVALVLFGQLFMTGTISKEHAQTHMLDAVALVIPVAGMLLGLVAITRRWARRPIDWVCLVLGCMGCGLFCLSFGWELFH